MSIDWCPGIREACFAEHCPDGQFGQQTAAQLPWFHIFTLLLCRQKKRLVAEYALSGIDKPIGVAEYQLLRDLPEPLGRDLPGIEQIEAEFAGELLPEDEESGGP